MATTTKNMTKAQAFAIALEVLNASAHPEKNDAMAKISKEIENIAKKSAGNGKPTAKQTANMGLGEMVVEFLRDHADTAYTVTELMKSVPGLPAEITNQKLTALFRLDNVKPFVERSMEKGKAYYKYATPSEVVED